VESNLHTTTCICGAVFNEAQQQQLYLLQSLLSMHLPRPKVTDKLQMLVTSLPNICFLAKCYTKYFFMYSQTPTAVGRVKVWTGKWSCNRLLGVGRGSSVGIATRYGLDGPVIESRWVARLSAPFQTGPGAHPSPLYNGYRVFPGGKAAGAWR
jgi:hypothetical protein